MTQRHSGDASRAATDELRKYRHGLKVMSGGFTLSGGEPLMQHRFAVKLFTAAKAMGIHTALDTNGYSASASPTPSWRRSTSCCSTSRPGIRSAIAASPAWTSAPTLDFARRLAARTTADLASLRPGAGPDRRPGRHRADRGVRRAVSATSSGSTCCRSTRWASTSGSSSAFPTRSGDANRRAWSWWSRSATCFATRGSRPIDVTVTGCRGRRACRPGSPPSTGCAAWS